MCVVVVESAKVERVRIHAVVNDHGGYGRFTSRPTHDDSMANSRVCRLEFPVSNIFVSKKQILLLDAKLLCVERRTRCESHYSRLFGLNIFLDITRNAANEQSNERIPFLGTF